MNNKNVKTIDDHNIERNANVMFALELDGSEYVVYWIERDTETNNILVSKVLRNIDGTYNMLNIEDTDKKEEVSNIVKTLISTAISDQNDKLVGTEMTLSNGKVVKFVNVSFNKEQNINVQKTYITTVKKEVTMVAEKYYDVVVAETKVAEPTPIVTPISQAEPAVAQVVEAVKEETPAVVEPITVAAPLEMPVLETPEVPVPAPAEPVPPVVATPEPAVVPTPVVPTVEQPTVVIPTPVVSEPVVAPELPVVESAPVVAPQPVQPEPVVIPTPVTPESVVAPVPEPAVVQTPVTPAVEQPTVVIPTPVVPEPVSDPVVAANQALVFNASKEKNLNAALGEVASSTTIPVENIEPVKEFGVDEPVTQPAAPVVPPVTPTETNNSSNSGKAGFANSKFFMVIAVAFFLASCIFLGYEVFNYFQLIK